MGSNGLKGGAGGAQAPCSYQRIHTTPPEPAAGADPGGAGPSPSPSPSPSSWLEPEQEHAGSSASTRPAAGSSPGTGAGACGSWKHPEVLPWAGLGDGGGGLGVGEWGLAMVWGRWEGWINKEEWIRGGMLGWLDGWMDGEMMGKGTDGCRDTAGERGGYIMAGGGTEQHHHQTLQKIHSGLSTKPLYSLSAPQAPSPPLGDPSRGVPPAAVLCP